MPLPPNWKRSNKNYSNAGARKQMASKGEPIPRYSRLKWLERCARREREDIDYWVKLGFSRAYLEQEMERLRSGAGFGNLARRG